MKRVLILSIGVLTSITFNAQTLSDAIKMMDNEQYESAGKVFQKLMDSEPTQGNNFYYAGENYFRSDMSDKAKALFQKGVDVNPTNALNYVGLGKILYNEGKVADANSNFFKAKTISQSKNAAVLMEIAEVYITSDVKNIAEALNLLNAALKLEPKNPNIYTAIGDAYNEQNDGTQAANNYEKALEIDKKFTKAILHEGRIWSHAKNYNLALKYYNDAINIDSTFAPAFRERGELRFRAGQADRAAADYQKYLKLNDNRSARIRYAEFLYASKNYKSAIDESNEVQKTDTTYINLYRILGYSYYETGKYPEGLMNMEKFMNKFSKAAVPGKQLLASDYEYLGKNQLKTGKDSLGTISLLKAIQMDSSKTDLYSDIAAGSLKQKNYPNAITYYKKKIESSKTKIGGANDYFGLGRAYYFTKDYVNADSAFAQLIRMQPTLPFGYLWRARCNTPFDLDSKKGLAYPFYEKVIEKVGTDVEKNKKDLIEAYEYMGYYNMLTKNHAKAKELWNKLLEIDPTNAKAKKALTDPNLK